MILHQKLVFGSAVRRGLSFIAVVAVMAITYLLSRDWYGHLHDSDKISFWVAAGTGALAFVTSLSVLETARILSREDIRHQESYAPIMTVEPHLIWGQSLDGFYLRNTGLGPAVKLELSYSGHLDIYVPKQEERNGQQVTTGEEFVRTESLSVSEKLDLVIHSPGSRTTGLGVNYGRGVQLSRIRLESLSLKYYDVFGNPYSTVYKSFNLESGENAFVWNRPRIVAR